MTTTAAPEPLTVPAHFSRALALDSSTLDEAERTVDLVFSTEREVEDFPGEFMVLDHSPQSIDLTRLNSTGPLLFNHDRDEHLGVVVRARLENRQGVATVKFSRSERGEAAFQDVKDGILRSVSVFGRIRQVRLESEEGGRKVFRATQWEPHEVSLVTVPADTGAVVRRAIAPTEETATVAVVRQVSTQEETPMSEDKNKAPDPTPAPVVTREAPDHNAALKADRKRIAEIQRTAQAVSEKKGLDLSDEVSRAVAEGTSVEDFTRSIFERALGAKPAAPVEIGLSERDKGRYSLRRALLAQANGGELDGLEREVSDECAKQLKRSPKGFFIPHEISDYADPAVGRALKRALVAGTAASGGYTVAEDLLAGSMIELLRNRMVLSTLGVQTLSGLTGDIAIPKLTGGATAYWLGEGDAVSDSQQTFGQLTLTPHRLQACTPFSKQLLAQSSVDVEALVRNDIMTQLAIAKDLAGIAGSGASGQPTGIINTTGVDTVTFGGPVTRAKMIEFQTIVAAENASRGALAYLTDPVVAGALMNIDESVGSGSWLWKGNVDEGTVIGRRAITTNQVPSNKVIYGNFSDAFFADWDGIDVVVDPYSRKKHGEVEITITLMTDFGVRHAASFAVSADAGNQSAE